MARVSDLFCAYSYNALVLKGVNDTSATADVVGWYESTSPACVDLSEAMVAANTEVDFTRYTRVVLVVDTRAGCTLSAVGTLDRQFYNTPDGQAFFGLVQISIPNAFPSTLAHAIGHTLRHRHGRFRNCGAVPWADTRCTSVAYGDPYDFSSLGTGHAVARRKELMGWVNATSNRSLGSAGWGASPG